jgi:hypothetical protein
MTLATTIRKEPVQTHEAGFDPVDVAFFIPWKNVCSWAADGRHDGDRKNPRIMGRLKLPDARGWIARNIG